MVNYQKNISDEKIISMIAKNSLKGWGQLYDKYSNVMYGIIFNLTKDRILAEEIFEETFLQLKEKQILSKVTHSLCFCILRHTNIFARQQLNKRGIIYSIYLKEESSLINILCSQNITLNEVVSKLKITLEEVKIKLRYEFLELRANTNKEIAYQPKFEQIEEYAFNSSLNKN